MVISVTPEHSFMGVYDFDRVIDRRPFSACKYIGLDKSLIAMNVADMDFAVPPEITEAMHRRINCTNYGYTIMSDEDYQAVIDWSYKRHGSKIL